MDPRGERLSPDAGPSASQFCYINIFRKIYNICSDVFEMWQDLRVFTVILGLPVLLNLSVKQVTEIGLLKQNYGQTVREYQLFGISGIVDRLIL